MTSRANIRDWLFRGLMLEADAEKFRAAGIRMGADQRYVEHSLLEETLTPFGVQLRDDALRMARLYALIFCFENSVRDLVSERLQEKHGITWWDEKVTTKVREFAEQRKKDAEQNSWLEGERRDPLSFIQFGHLSDIITNNWDEFADLIPSQHWMKQRFDELEKARNYIAHNRLLLPSEFARLEMYVGDWDRQVGF